MLRSAIKIIAEGFPGFKTLLTVAQAYRIPSVKCAPLALFQNFSGHICFHFIKSKFRKPKSFTFGTNIEKPVL